MSEIQYGQYVVSQPEELVKFNVGQPSPSMLSLEVLKTGLEYTASVTNPSLLQYGDISGYKQFRQSLAKFLEHNYTLSVNYKDLFITNGNTHAINFICSVFLETGSTVYVEEPSYFLALNIFKELKLNIVSIPIQTDGINLDILERNLKKTDDTKYHILYTIPIFHNPTSYTMSHEKRLKLAELANQYKKFLILADEVYQLLNFYSNNNTLKPLYYYSDKAISLGSFSKILAPAYRLGWIQSKNEEIMNILLKSPQYDSSGGSSPITQSIIHGIIESGKLSNHITLCQKFLQNNCVHMTNILRDKLYDFADFIEPKGGYFIWLKLKSLDTKLVLLFAETFKVQFHSGTKFSSKYECSDYIRLSFSYYDYKGIIIGITRLYELFSYVKSIQNKKLIAILGYKGKLGSKIVNALSFNTELAFVEGIDRTFNMKYIDCYSTIIDVSRPEATEKLVDKLIKLNKHIPLLIGTTGNLPIKQIEEYSKIAPVCIVSNFSLGIPVLLTCLKHIDVNQWNISITESHHVTKVDSPSGTALTLQETIGKKVPIESIRHQDIIGEHTITLERNDEIITIHHTAKNRDLFANGALNYISWITQEINGLFFNTTRK